MGCKVCGKDVDIRSGVCFTCAEMESIIDEGLDMYNKGPAEDSVPARSAMEKLLFMRKTCPSYFRDNP